MLDFSTFPRVVAVVGSREYPKLSWVDNAVSRFNPKTIVVSGGARGVDREAKKAAEKYGHHYKPFHVEDFEWGILGKSVGFTRNAAVVFYIKRYNGHVLIFAVEVNGELTGGSQNVIDLCKEIGADYTVINQEGKITWTTSAHFATKHEKNQ